MMNVMASEDSSPSLLSLLRQTRLVSSCDRFASDGSRKLITNCGLNHKRLRPVSSLFTVLLERLYLAEQEVKEIEKTPWSLFHQHFLEPSLAGIYFRG